MIRLDRYPFQNAVNNNMYIVYKTNDKLPTTSAIFCESFKTLDSRFLSLKMKNEILGEIVNHSP